MKAYNYVKEFGEGIDRICNELESRGVAIPSFHTDAFILKATLKAEFVEEHVAEEGWPMVKREGQISLYLEGTNEITTESSEISSGTQRESSEITTETTTESSGTRQKTSEIIQPVRLECALKGQPAHSPGQRPG